MPQFQYSRVALASVAGVFAVVAAASAAVVETDAFSKTGQTTFDGLISSTDLVETGSPALAGVTATDGATFPLSGLNDGSASTSTNLTYWGGTSLGYELVTFTLNTSTNTSGYDITDITKFQGWGDSAARFGNQVFDVSYSTVAAPASFNLLKSVSYEPFPIDNSDSTNNASMVTLTDSTGVLASGVKAIQFKLYPVPGQTSGEVGVIREIDINGVPTLAPEPASLGLVAFGCLGLLSRRRRF